MNSASTNSVAHTIGANGTDLILDDFNKLLTRAKRINTAWTGGTPEGRIKGITDLIMSPEAVQGLRAMAYNPINTNPGPGAGDAIAATDEMRNAIYQNAGIPEFYGISIMEINELGAGQKFTNVWNGLGNADNDLVIGLDRSRESLFRAVALDSETGSEFTLLADDQYSVRQQKIGYFGSLEEGRMILDDRVLTGITL